MAQRRTHYFVTGPGVFPDDMLRYDNAAVIGTGYELLGRPAILIDGYCTPARWSSFLWACFPARQHYPAGDSERGPIEWQAEVQGKWETVPKRTWPPRMAAIPR